METTSSKMNDSESEYYRASADGSATLNNGSQPASIFLAEYNLTLESVPYNSMTIDAQISIVNVTREYPFNYATIMFGYIMPFVLILTIITNTLVVMVLAQRHMRTPTNIVLLTMAIVDMMTLLSPSPWYFYIYTLGHHDKLLYPPICCYIHHIMTDVVPIFFHTSSIWLALLLASQRYIYVCHPTLASTWCTVPRVRKAIIIILVIAFVHQFTRLFDNTFSPIYLQTDFGYQLACKNEIANWVQHIDIAVYYTTYFTFRILFVLVIPCVALITLNCLLFGALRRAENKRTELLKTRFKIIGGNHCSTGGLAKNTSYAINSDRRIITEPMSGLSMANQRKPSIVSTVQRESRRTKSDKKRKFSITSFTIRCLAKHDQTSSRRSSLIGSKPRNQRQTSDKRSSNFIFDDPSQLVSDRMSCVDDGTAGSAYRRGRITRENFSQDSNDNCSNAMQTKECCSADGNNKKRIEASLDERSKCPENNQEQLGLGHEDEDENENENQSAKEDDSACYECATCKQSETCQGCSTISNEGATCGILAASGDNHQAVSQCSSLIGGATNTTTNSCNNTQNASLSLLAANDGTMDGIESASVRGDEIADIERESLSLQNNDSDSKDDDETTRGSHKLPKSCSVGHRLACGCLPSMRKPTVSSFKQSSSRSSSKTSKRNCRECYLAGMCRNSPKKLSSRMSRGKRSIWLQSSSSNPSLDSKGETCDRERLHKNNICNNESNNDKMTDTASDNNTNNKNNNNNNNDDSNNNNKPLITSHSYYGNETSEYKKRSIDDTQNSGGTVTVATVTTTATATCSTNANSIGSLLQVQQNQSVNPPIKRQQTAYQTNASPQARTKSPSFASSIGGGRGSRTTSVAGSNLPPNLSSNLATTSASIRTMDSNRTTLMLIVVVTVFLLVEVPVALVTIAHVIFNTLDAFADVDFEFNYIKLFTNFFIMISYSVNFTIYCSMSKKFRETFRDLFMCGKRDKRRRLLYQQQQHSQYNQHQFTHSNNPDNQVMTLNATNINNNAANTLGSNLQNDFTSTIGGLNHNINLARYYPYRRANSAQQECEL